MSEKVSVGAVECCGKVRSSKFCPECGSRIDRSLDCLLDYLWKKSEKRAKDVLDTQSEIQHSEGLPLDANDKEEEESRMKKRIKGLRSSLLRAESDVRRWETWHESLATLMMESTNETEEPDS